MLDYTQYYLNLPEANSGTANWLIEYSLLEYYSLPEITAISLHDLADRFTQFNDYAFVRYVGREKFFPKSDSSLLPSRYSIFQLANICQEEKRFER